MSTNDESQGRSRSAKMRDVCLALLLVISVASVPNVLQAVVHKAGISDQASKFLAISSLAFGATLMAPLFFGRSGPQGGEKRVRFALPALLVAAGLVASCYKLAIIGLGSSEGLGAGLAETLDSGLAPSFYVIAAICAGTAQKSGRALSGMVLSVAGLGLVASTQLWSAGATSGTLWPLVMLGIAGALGTAVSLWLVRRLVRHHSAKLGFCVACRYGGVALVYLLCGVFMGGSFDPLPLLFAFAGGAILITCAFYAAVHIDSELMPAAAMAAVPLFTFALEGVFSLLGLANLKQDLSNPILWVGVCVTGAGIWALQRDPSSGVA